MALVIGENSYITIDEADAYFEDRLYTDVWDEATQGNKRASLIGATKAIEAFKFKGKRYNTIQKLSFPRIGIYADNILLDGSIVPQDIKDAVCEYAILMLQDDYNAPDDLEEFDSISIGAIKIDASSSKRNKSIPPAVALLLSNYKDTSVRLVRA